MEEDKLLQAIAQLERDGSLKKLYSYADYLNWLHKLPRELEPKDIVHEAIMRLITGQRNWNSEKHPDIVAVLIGIIRSLHSHAWELAYNNTRVDLGSLRADNVNVESVTNLDDDSDDRSEAYEQLRKRIEVAIGNDEDLMKVYFAVVDGCTMPKEIAEFLNMDVKDVNILLRRLRRKCRNHSKNKECA